ncbi:hypothetical protein Sjap_015459 [Stephania japonica]|uniref:Uncharacterized protein n=1 Tax=Stephania japonica TaxID=461633 RepID=A0AAP0NQU7_9MAGN
MVFDSIKKNEKIFASADWLLCNSSYELKPSDLLAIGPLLAGNQLGNLWPEDPTCFSWLDQQAPKSVIYLSFGSTTTFNEAQFHELALGLELLNRPFLWVIRPDCTSSALPNGFEDRVADRGKIVG